MCFGCTGTSGTKSQSYSPKNQATASKTYKHNNTSQHASGAGSLFGTPKVKMNFGGKKKY